MLKYIKCAGIFAATAADVVSWNSKSQFVVSWAIIDGYSFDATCKHLC